MPGTLFLMQDTNSTLHVIVTGDNHCCVW